MNELISLLQVEFGKPYGLKNQGEWIVLRAMLDHKIERKWMYGILHYLITRQESKTQLIYKATFEQAKQRIWRVTDSVPVETI